MLYLIAIVLPPLAMLLTGKPFQAIICLVLQITLLGWLPAALWAVLVVHNHEQDKRTDRLVKEMRRH